MAGDPDILVFLTSARTEFEGRAMGAALEAEGIPVKVFAGTARMAQWEIGYNDPIKVMVRRSDLERARAVIRTARAQARAIDWSQVDVNEPATYAKGAMCEVCGHPLADLPTDTTACPACGAALDADAEEPPPEGPPRAPFAARWGKLRQFATMGLIAAFFLPMVHTSYALPILAILVFSIAFGDSTKRRPVHRT